MAIDRTGISSLQTGAPDIKYTGDEGPKSPDQQLMASADPMLVEEYNKYVFEMEEQGLQPISFKEFIQQVMSGMAEGGIARLGYRGGQLVQPGPGRPGYRGSDWGPGAGSPGTPSGGMGEVGGGDAREARIRQQNAATYVAPAPVQPTVSPIQSIAMVGDTSLAGATQSQAAATVAERTAVTADEGFVEPRLTAEEAAATEAFVPRLTAEEAAATEAFVPRLTAEEAAATEAFVPRLTAEQAAATEAFVPRLTAEQAAATEAFVPRLTTEQAAAMEDAYTPVAPTSYPTDIHPDVYDTTVPTGDGEGLGGEGITSVPIDTTTATTAAEAGTDFAEAKAAAIAEAAGRSLPFEDYYVGGDPTEAQEKFMREHQAAASMVGREAWPAAEGGRARQRYGLGSLVKKAFKAVKKIAKSPVGMMALTGVLGGLPMFQGVGGAGAPKMSAWKKWIGPMLMGSPAGKGPEPEQSRLTGGLWNWIKGNPMKSIGLMSMLPFITQGKGEDEPSWAGNYGPGIDPEAIARKVLAGGVDPAEFRFVQPHLRAAQGGRIGYQDGRSARSVALNQLYGIMPKRKFAQEGGLMDMGGMEKDYREEGGFVPIGGQERADDVPARLSKNEFVFTADAVRAAGGGDIDAGAEVMENVMNNLEQGGQVSEESQGLEGARNMFATAQRLEGVL